MIAPMIENKAGYVIPGRGARQLGMVGDDEMVFTLPAGKLENLLTGLRETMRKEPNIRLIHSFSLNQDSIKPSKNSGGKYT
jgi:uncharacterized protein (DUF169 family)